jgi:hypothetical protein
LEIENSYDLRTATATATATKKLASCLVAVNYAPTAVVRSHHFHSVNFSICDARSFKEFIAKELEKITSFHRQSNLKETHPRIYFILFYFIFQGVHSKFVYITSKRKKDKI